MIVLPLAFGQSPSPPGAGDVINSTTINNGCMDAYRETTQKIREVYLEQTGQINLDRESYKTDPVCEKKLQDRRAAAEQAAYAKVAAADDVLKDCQTKPSGEGTVLKGGVEENVKLEKAKAGVYTGGAEEYGKRLPRMTGSVLYKGTTLTVTTAAGRLVRQAVEGPVAFASSPRTYGRAQGVITSSSEFTITSLWNLKGRQVLARGEMISVPIRPNRQAQPRRARRHGP